MGALACLFSAAKWGAVARPMPDPPPVMKIAFRATRSLPDILVSGEEGRLT